MKPPGQAPTRAVIYTRISRDDSGEGKSNARQEETCRQLAASRDWQVVEVVADISVSAYSGKSRPGWERVLEMIRGGEVDVVMAWAQDRITRTVAELSRIILLCKEHDVSITTVSGDLDLSTPQGKAVATILGSIAEMEVEHKSERQKLGNMQRRAEGKHWSAGWTPFGYSDNGNVRAVVPRQAELIRKAADDVLAGKALKAVAREWAASGMTTPRSRKGADGWTHNGVRTILLNPVTAGILTYKGEEVGPGSWEPILSESTLRQLQALLGDAQRRTGKPGRRPQELLSGIGTCFKCGYVVGARARDQGKLEPARDDQETPGRVGVYRCTNPKGEHINAVRADADAFVIEAITKGEGFANSTMLPKAAKREGTDKLQAKLDALTRRMDAVTKRFMAGKIEESTYDGALDGINAEKAQIAAQIEASEGDRRTSIALARACTEAFLALPKAQQRLVIGEIAEVKFHPLNGKNNVPIDMRVSVFAKRMDGRISPLVAGKHPDALAIQQEHYDRRDAEHATIVDDGR